MAPGIILAEGHLLTSGGLIQWRGLQSASWRGLQSAGVT
jgi:hypothetical protein